MKLVNFGSLAIATALGLTLVVTGCSNETAEEIDKTYSRLEERGINPDNVINDNILPDASGVWVEVKTETDEGDVFFVQIEDRGDELTIVAVDDKSLDPPIDIEGSADDEIASAQGRACM